MSNWSSSYANSNGIRIHYHRTGGEEPHLLLAHGATDNGLCWGRLVRALEKEYDCVLTDARGHGLSDKPESGDAPDHVADLAGLITALGSERPVVIGHSMGGNTATALASLYPDAILGRGSGRPRLVGVAVAQKSGPHVPEWRQNSAAMQAMSAAEIEKMGQRSPLWADEEFPAGGSSQTAGQYEYVQQHHPALHPLAGERSPLSVTRVACDRRDRTGRDHQRRDRGRSRAINPLIRVAHIPGAGHNIRREQFDAFLAAVRGFLGGIGS